jgi:hypothetical protein
MYLNSAEKYVGFNLFVKTSQKCFTDMIAFIYSLV